MILAPPLTRSLRGNSIGDEGASALAAILKETKITNLKCAATPACLLSCQRPLTRLLSLTLSTLLLVHSLLHNNLTNKAKQVLKDAAGSGVRIRF